MPGSSSPLLKISLKSGEAIVVSFSGLCANRAGSACSVDGTGLNYDGSRLPGSDEALQLGWRLPMVAFPLHAVGARTAGRIATDLSVAAGAGLTVVLIISGFMVEECGLPLRGCV